MHGSQRRPSKELLFCVALWASRGSYIGAERRHPNQRSHSLSTAPTDRVRSYPFTPSGVPYDDTSIAIPVADSNENYRQIESLDVPIVRNDESETLEFPEESRAPAHPDVWHSASSPQVIPPLRTQVVYRYYARQKVRTASSGSIPFMLIGPHVDHWKAMGQQLSARGFHVIAVGPRDEISASNTEQSHSEGPSMVLQLLDALRWNQVVLVGCDDESILAIEAALSLAPHRVAGLILCGKLQGSEKRLETLGSTVAPSPTTTLELDRFLHTRLACPFTIIWDGNTETSPPSEENGSTSSTEHVNGHYIHRHRTILLGGGTAPHRRRPEIFAWILTRFVEEKIAPPVDVTTPFQRRQFQSAARRSHTDGRRSSAGHATGSIGSSPSWRGLSLPIPWRVNEMFNEESMVVFGRMAATALFYGMALRVLFYQYDNVRLGFDIVSTARRNVIAVLGRRTTKLWSCLVFVWTIPRRLCQGDKQVVSSIGVDELKSTAVNDQAPNNTSSDTPSETEARPFFFLDHVVA